MFQVMTLQIAVMLVQARPVVVLMSLWKEALVQPATSRLNVSPLVDVVVILALRVSTQDLPLLRPQHHQHQARALCRLA